MNFVSDAPAPGQVDPRELTANQLAALRAVHTFKLSRVRNGWRAPGSPLVTLATMQVLGAKRLVMRRDVGGSARMEITGTGINTLAVADSRKRNAA
jgi:hypothetical protein